MCSAFALKEKMKNSRNKKRISLTLSAVICTLLGLSSLSGGHASGKPVEAQQLLALHMPFKDLSQKRLERQIIQNPLTLSGLHKDNLDLIFKQPDLKRHDGNTMLVQYRGSTCVLNILINKETSKVKSVSLRSRGHVAADKETSFAEKIHASEERMQCLRVILEQQKEERENPEFAEVTRRLAG